MQRSSCSSYRYAPLDESTWPRALPAASSFWFCAFVLCFFKRAGKERAALRGVLHWNLCRKSVVLFLGGFCGLTGLHRREAIRHFFDVGLDSGNCFFLNVLNAGSKFCWLTRRRQIFLRGYNRRADDGANDGDCTYRLTYSP